MINECQRQELEQKGFFCLRGYFSNSELRKLEEEVTRLIERSYTSTNLKSGSIYPTIGKLKPNGRGDNRISHSMMIATGKSLLPYVEHKDLKHIDKLLLDHNKLIGDLTRKTVPDSARSLLSSQQYFGNNKPFESHFDAISLATKKKVVLEAVIPRFVAILVIEDRNNGVGLELTKGDIKFSPHLHEGDLILLENTSIQHGVPYLPLPRVSLGLRNYDHQALHFAKIPELRIQGAEYRKTSQGWVSDNANYLERFQKHNLMSDLLAYS